MPEGKTHVFINSIEALRIGNAIALSDGNRKAIVLRPGEIGLYNERQIVNKLREMLEYNGISLSDKEKIMAWIVEEALNKGYYPFEALEGGRYLLGPIIGKPISREEMNTLFGGVLACINNPQLQRSAVVAARGL